MSQHTVYKCDNDGKEIGRKIHITLAIGQNGQSTGVAVPPPGEKGGAWRVSGLPYNFLHFHDAKCIGAFFEKQIKKVTVSKEA